jgi:DNA repair exonuclease SbcCD ATPase subunit
VNEVKLVVTGQYRPSGAVDKAKKDLAELAKFAAQAERVAKGLNEELDTGAKRAAKSTDAAKEAIKKLGKETDDAFDKLKAKMEESFKAAEEERVIKVKAEYDKQRLKNSFDSFTFDVDISSGLGPKLAAAYGKTPSARASTSPRLARRVPGRSSPA